MNSLEKKIDRKYIIGICLFSLGFVAMFVGAMYIWADLAHSRIILILDSLDGWHIWLIKRSYYLFCMGVAAMIAGTLLRWNAEEALLALEATNRFVPYKPKQGGMQWTR